jgi:hypothetical protein
MGFFGVKKRYPYSSIEAGIAEYRLNIVLPS